MRLPCPHIGEVLFSAPRRSTFGKADPIAFTIAFCTRVQVKVGRSTAYRHKKKRAQTGRARCSLIQGLRVFRFSLGSIPREQKAIHRIQVSSRAGLNNIGAGPFTRDKLLVSKVHLHRHFAERVLAL